MTTLGEDSRRLAGNRFVDDLLSNISLDTRSALSKREADGLAQRLLHECYPQGLTLERENIEEANGKKTFRFLEAKITIARNTTTVEHWNKNITAILETGRQKFFNIQHAKSFGNRDTKRGVIVSRVLAIDRLTRDPGLKIFGVGNLFIELRLLGYSTRILKQVCRNMYRRTRSPLWVLASRFLT